MGQKSAAPTPTFDKYQAEDDHRTLQRAEEVKSDQGRMTAVRKHHIGLKQRLGRVGRIIGRHSR